MQPSNWRELIEQEEKIICKDHKDLARVNLKLCRALADATIDERGHLHLETIDQMIKVLGQRVYHLVPGFELDTLRRFHILKVLKALKQPQIAKRIHALGIGLHNKAAEKLIFQTLLWQNIFDRAAIDDRKAKVAVICAWMTFLRQNVGSCFATAPAITIQSHHPDRFLQDMHQLLQEGVLTRIIAGNEVSVPLLTFWGSGDLWRPVRIDEKTHLSCELINALTAADEADQLGEKEEQKGVAAQKRLKQWTEKRARDQNLPGQIFKLSPGRILREILLEQFQLSEEQFETWEKRSKALEKRALETSGILMQTPQANASYTQLCQQLSDKEERAQLAFKATTDNALLRAWEYTLASFSESRADFQQWNLSTALGMHGQPGGLSERLNELINEQIQACNEEIRESQEKADQIRPQVIYVHGKLQSAKSEQDLQWARAEYYQVKAELDSVEESGRDRFRKGEKLAILGQWFLEKCVEGFRDQFQEVYDPDLRPSDLQVVDQEVTDDTPAGFRLIAKEGRSLAQSWLRITSGDQFIEIVCRFFSDIEAEFRTWPEVNEIEREFSQIITRIIQFVRQENFACQAIDRLKDRKGIPKERLPPTPWAYISGGNLEDLLQQYCSLPSAPTSRPRWFDDVRDFWVYLIDEVQRAPAAVLDSFERDPQAPLLMCSPDHAFNLKPGLRPFCQSWQQRGYPYSFIRDQFERPVQKFYSELWLSADQQRFLIDKWSLQLQQSAAIYLPIKLVINGPPCRLIEFYERLSNSLLYHPLASGLMSTFDALLFSTLPFLESSAVESGILEVYKRAKELAPERSSVAQESIIDLKNPMNGGDQSLEKDDKDGFIPAHEFWKQLLTKWKAGRSASNDDLTLLQQAAVELGFLAPSPIEFADSNWTRESFAFAINPGTLSLEIWCVERWGQKGRPMANWRPWLDGSNRDRKWAVYPQTASPDFFQIERPH